MGVGGAITIQSDAEQEFTEALLKGKVLVETIALLTTPGGTYEEVI